MGQAKVSKDRREGKHLTQKERIQIEALLNAGVLPKEIAVLLGRSRRTVERERRRGEVEHRRSDWGTETVYNADRGQDVHDLCATAKGPQMKIDRNREMEEFICKRIAGKKESPAVIAVELKKRGEEWSVCAKTIYNYIEQGEIAGITNDDLWEKTLRAKGKRRKVKVCKKHPRRNSIEKRPESVEDREEFGHWEIDLIAGPQGGSKAALLTLVERKTRMTIIRKLPDKTQGSVIRAINGIERKFGAVRFRKIFKTITSDNGSEFLDVEGLEGSCLSKKKRVDMYYAHAYASCERGTNENTNRIVRRFVAKGTNIARVTRERIRWIENWINTYPRKIIDFDTAEERFKQEIAA